MSGDGLSDIVRIRNGEVCYCAGFRTPAMTRPDLARSGLPVAARVVRLVRIE
jgi:hypothetical protein